MLAGSRMVALGGAIAAFLLQGCQVQSVDSTEHWHAQCTHLGFETGTDEMAACVSRLRSENEAAMFSVVAVY